MNLLTCTRCCKVVGQCSNEPPEGFTCLDCAKQPAAAPPKPEPPEQEQQRKLLEALRENEERLKIFMATMFPYVPRPICCCHHRCACPCGCGGGYPQVVYCCY